MVSHSYRQQGVPILRGVAAQLGAKMQVSTASRLPL